MNTEKKLQALPFWDGELSPRSLAFNTGMQFHGPFIATTVQARNDLGQCIISTFAPHIVCKIHAFKTNFEPKPGKDGYNLKFREITDRENENRMAYLAQRAQAFDNIREAYRLGTSVREYIEQQGRVYDEEFDEPRLVVKVPGMNAYLELIGCLDSIDESDIAWEGDKGIFGTLNYMALWAQNVWDRHDRRPRGSRSSDEQPLQEWKEDYDPEIRPMMTRKQGLGHTFIDPSRRPDLLYSKAPVFDKNNHEIVKLIKHTTASLASDGIAPENYGK